jgi:hypothetical protein
MVRRSGAANALARQAGATNKPEEVSRATAQFGHAFRRGRHLQGVLHPVLQQLHVVRVRVRAAGVHLRAGAETTPAGVGDG